MKKVLFMLTIICSIMVFAQHEFLDVPKLSDEDLISTKSKLQEDAPAEVLYRSYHYRIDYNGFMYTDIIDRVKIYKKDNAQDYLDHEFSVYDNGHGDRETLSNLKAVTYNMDNGKVIVDKIKGDSKFKSKEDKNYTVTKFAFQNVKDGSVVEYSYSIMTPFLVSTPKIIVEEEIPIRYMEYVFDTPKILGYNINYKGSLSPNYRDFSEKNIYGGEYKIYRFGYDNIPAYKDEEFVLNNDNYKTTIRAELNSTYFNNLFKSYATSWEDIRKRMYDSDNFGYQLKKQGAADDVLPADIKAISGVKERAAAVLKFVQNTYTYNGEDDVFTDKGIKNLISTKIGNTAEINLLLTMLMRSAKIPNTYPVALSTVKRGLLLSYSPSIAQFNYVVASFEDDGKIYLLDGTSKLTTINMIKPKALNYYGFIMTDKEAKQINIIYPDISETYLTADAKMTPEGTFEGHFSDVDTKLYAMMVNQSYIDDKDAYKKTYQDKYKFPFTNIKSGLKENNDFETSFDFTSDTFVDALGSKLVFNPLLFLYSQNHSYNQTQKRKAPLEFYSSSRKIKKVTITIPDGYVFENVPKSKKFRTEDNALQYFYVVTQEGNKLTVETTTVIDDSVFPAEYYPAFQQIFDNITKLEGQVVTAVKK